MGRQGPQQASGRGEPEPQTIHHHSHYDHLLHRTVISNDRAVCDGCLFSCSGVAYICNPCDYLLHKSCATAPPTIQHQGHRHVLVFATKPPYRGGTFGCDACGQSGKGFCFRCDACGFDLHIHCVRSGQQGSTSARTGRARLQTSSSADNTWESRTGTVKNVLQSGAALTTMANQGLQIRQMWSDQHGTDDELDGESDDDDGGSPSSGFDPFSWFADD